MKRIISLILLIALLASCTGRPADLIPDKNPQVAISSINGKDTRQAALNKSKLYAPGANLGSTVVEVTASDDTMVGKIELLLNGESIKVIDANKDKKIFSNPFSFEVGFEGTGTDNKAILRAIATDNRNKQSIHETEVIVDSSPPVVEITSITGLEGATAGSLKGTILINGRAYDPESGINIDAFKGAEVRAYLDGDPNKVLNLSADTETPQTSFVAVIENLADGPHFVTLFARNGANVFASTTRTFLIDASQETP